ncbi:retropepsin-like aspartic protease [Pedobacter gandavensis]|uniref:retropepsin-like aspartic protease n=1 Tax=Pedobacter gandavensis TaxID=2679963 RepID=UPI00292E2F7F|nr:retropepsin-like aspartic protease [Pedobacter gandavensis]
MMIIPVKRLLTMAAIGLFSFTNVLAQKTVILPYKVFANKMIVEVTINGKLVPMIFDTGGKNAMDSKLQESLGLSATHSKDVIDVSRSKKSMDVVTVNTLDIAKGGMAFKNVPFLVIDTEIFPCLRVRGLIGSDLWQNNTIEIDDQKKVITITAGGSTAMLNNPKALPFLPNGGGAPLFSIKVGDFDQARVVFDSGADGFLALRKADYPRLESQGALFMIREGSSVGSIGVNGRGQNGSRILLEIPELTISGGKFSKLRIGVGSALESLFGYQLLSFGKVTIDYVHKKFLFEPFPEFSKEKIENTKKYWDLELRPENQQMVVSSVWDRLKGEVEMGDVVTHINGKKITQFSNCENLINELPELIGQEKALFRIQTKTGVKDIEVIKE